MLALKSSITTTVNGCVSFWKNEMGCRFPLSRIVSEILFQVGHEPALGIGDSGQYGARCWCRP